MSAFDMPDPRRGEPFNGQRGGIWYIDGAPDPMHVREVAADRVLVARRLSRFHIDVAAGGALREAHEARILREHAS